jgi:hypothetical protein
MCAFVEAFPYDIPPFVPDILVELERHLHDPQPIPKTIKNMFQVTDVTSSGPKVFGLFKSKIGLEAF